MRGPGMWMPKQKSGKNWVVKFSGFCNDERFTRERSFRVRQGAEDFRRELRAYAVWAVWNGVEFYLDRKITISKIA